MTHRLKKTKSLLIFDLNGTLCYYTKEYAKYNSIGLHSKDSTMSELKINPNWEQNNQAIFNRPNLRSINYDLLIKGKKKYDIGIWSSQDMQTTDQLVRQLFGRFYTQLLFVIYNKDRGTESLMTSQTNKSVAPVAMERNFSSIWHKFPQYNDENTLMISNSYNLIADFNSNDIVLPTFDPVNGSADFLDDKHLKWMTDYLTVLESVEHKVGPDVRQQMIQCAYSFYLQRVTRTVQGKADYDPRNQDVDNPHF